MNSFTLTGVDIKVQYSADDGKLSVQGTGLRGGHDMDFSGENLLISTSDLGTVLTAVLLASDRGGNQTRLSVLVPSGVRRADGESLADEGVISGAAIIVTDRTRSMRKTGPMQDFDVRQLSGTMDALQTELES